MLLDEHPEEWGGAVFIFFYDYENKTCEILYEFFDDFEIARKTYLQETGKKSRNSTRFTGSSYLYDQRRRWVETMMF